MKSPKDMDLRYILQIHLAVVLHLGLNKLHVFFSLVILPEIPNHCDKPVPRYLENSLHSTIFYICGPTKTPALNFDADSLGKEFWRYLKPADS